MQPTRRRLLTASAALAASPLLVRSAWSQAANPPPSPTGPADPRMAPREEGSPNAKDRVEEWFSFTCPHCARSPGSLSGRAGQADRHRQAAATCSSEFPRDQLDLMAAMVARSLPPSRYEPFVMALFATQQHWAFTQTSTRRTSWRRWPRWPACRATCSTRSSHDQALKQALLDAQSEAEQRYNIDSTPTFIVNGKAHSGEMTYDRFAAWSPRKAWTKARYRRPPAAGDRDPAVSSS